MSGQPHREDVELLRRHTLRGNTVAAVYVRHPEAASIVLYSHDNAADLGHLYQLFLHLSFNLRVNVLGLRGSRIGKLLLFSQRSLAIKNPNLSHKHGNARCWRNIGSLLLKPSTFSGSIADDLTIMWQAVRNYGDDAFAVQETYMGFPKKYLPELLAFAFAFALEHLPNQNSLMVEQLKELIKMLC
ncbi:hypothetical protein GUJ93_ZPchr0011g27737 [Zizania palustris]|uniref:Uncharacterized protein n=1 Tax=Zizania palustris TaxID=103762 RepID=A0A8J5WI88_ZIZPA|nr:hypothetical protein GUJ93_ZPchr0011g27737 [Zizania palustris]